MKKQVFGRKFKRDVNERKALFKGLLSELVIHERIETTEEKAKAIKGDFEKLVTKARKGGNNALRLIQPYLYGEAVKKLMDDVAPRFAKRPGGYTRIVRVGRRFNDDASMVILELVERSAIAVSTKAEKVAVAAEAKIDTKTEKKKTAAKAAPVKKIEKKEAAKTKKETKK